MTFTINVVLLLVSIVLFLWFALLHTDVISWGTSGFLLGCGLAAFAASFLPWRNRTTT
jgi:hypothetical protein